jgi:antitoxin VapB
MVERHVKLFKNGRNQAVRIPREFELPGEETIIRKEGQRLIIEPAPPKSLLAVLATLPTLEEEFPPIEDLPAEAVALWRWDFRLTPMSFRMSCDGRVARLPIALRKSGNTTFAPASSWLPNYGLALPGKPLRGWLRKLEAVLRALEVVALEPLARAHGLPSCRIESPDRKLAPR